MEVIGIPKSVESQDLKHVVCKVFNSIGFNIGEDTIQVCHRLTKPGRTIVSFSRRKDCQHLIRIKKGLNDLNPINLSFPDGIKIYVNDGLCLHHWGLWNECKKLWNNKKIYSYFSANGSVRIKQVENGSYKDSYKSITHVNDLRALYPGANFHVLSYLGFYKLLRSFLNCVYLVILSVCVMYLAIFWRLFFRTLPMMFVICHLYSFICVVLLFYCVLLFCVSMVFR